MTVRARKRVRVRVAFVLALAVGPLAQAAEVQVKSPNAAIRFTVGQQGGHLSYRLTFKGRPVIETSPLGIVVDGADLGRGATLGKAAPYKIHERYAWRGVHSEAVNESNGARISVAHAGSQTRFTVDVRVFNDAAAFRFVVPGSERGERRVPDAATGFRLPGGSTVWCAGVRDHYEGLYVRKDLKDVVADEWATPPLTFRLPRATGYASITEAALRDYAGMTLQADGKGGFLERLGHAPPASYPYTLRYGDENAKRLSVPAAVSGTITTPWRVVLLGSDLGALVNSDAIHNLSPPHDPKFFPQGLKTPWLRPGRAVWRYLDGPPREDQGAEGTQRGFAVIKEFSRMAGELGFEHQIVEGQWRRWSDEQIRELVAYSSERGVGIWLWIHSRDNRDAAKRRELFQRLHKLGVAGIKMDFFDHEAKELIDLYEAVLQDAAESQLLVDFHGANKPTGESRPWPNEMTREAVRGLEHRSTPAWAEYNTTVPFTRFLAGPADYTPMIFGERRKDTTWAHQIATVVVFTSPLMVYGANPKNILENPAVEVIKSIPTVWDETRVLPGSAIGEAAAFARRSGDRWFLGVLNGPNPRSFKVDLSFLGKGNDRATLIRDQEGDGAALAIEHRNVSSEEVLDLTLGGGGGFVARFDRDSLH